MSRDGNGTYTLPANGFNPAVTGADITAADWEQTAADLETAMSASIAKDGQTVTTAVVPFASGVKTDTIVENTSAAGVTIDSVLLKDGGATLKDSVTYLADNTDATKKAQFQCSAISTGTTRLFTLPDADGTLATLAGTETLTNKTFGAASATGTQKWAKGADIASPADGSITLGADGNYFDITGTNVITSVDTIAVGTVVKLHFDAALTLTHHATDLVLPGGANITTAAGDEAEFVEYAAGDWRCTCYTKASGGPVAKAAQADMEAQTADKFPDGANLKYHPLMPKAWALVTVSGGTPALTAGAGFSATITDNGVGDYSFTLSTAMSSANYIILPHVFDNVTFGLAQATEKTTTTMRIKAVDRLGTATDFAAIMIIVMGDL